MLVEHAVNSSDVRKKLFETFQKTIVSIEGRYELLTDILAVRELVERDSGMTAEGMSVAEVAVLSSPFLPMRKSTFCSVAYPSAYDSPANILQRMVWAE